MRISLVIMAKWPEIGQTKTRLAEEYGSEDALAIARAMLADTIFRLGRANPTAFGLGSADLLSTAEVAAGATIRHARKPSILPESENSPAGMHGVNPRPGDTGGIVLRRVLAFAPREAAGAFAQLAAEAFVLVPQSSGDLGQRLQTLLLNEWAAGQEAVIFFGTDSPTLPLQFIGLAAAWLRRAEVVLGPASDGGYYLLGCRWSLRWLVHLASSEWPVAGNLTPCDLRVQLPAILVQQRLPIFDGIDWGSSQVLAQTVARLQTTRLRWALLPVWYDVDTAGDWALLRAHLRALEEAGQECCLPNLGRLS